MNKLNLIAALVLATFAFSQPTFATGNTTSVSVEKEMVKTQQTINLNAASAKEIAQVLTGVGIKKALAIVDYRDAHGEFKAIEELASVKGIGAKTIAKNESRILLK